MSNLLHQWGIGRKSPTVSTFWYVQSASYALPIPIVYGCNRCAASMIHLPSSPTRKDGKSKSDKSGQNYTAPVVFGICEGPITALGLLWVDSDKPTFFSSGIIQNQADENDTIPATGPYTIVVQAVLGSGTYLSDINVYDVTSGVWLTRIPDNASPSPATGQYQLDGTLNGKYYFNSAQHSHSVIINYFYGTTVTNGFPGAWVLKLGTTPTQTVWSELTSSFPAQAVTYPGIAYMAHPAANFPSNNAQQFSYEVFGLAQFNPGGSPAIYDANGADILTDFLTNALHGANLPAASIGDLTAYRAYGAAFSLFSSPVIKDQQAARDHLSELFEVTNSGPYWSDGLLKVVPYGDTAQTANGFTFTPNTTPLYSLTDVDFLPNSAVSSGQGGGSGDRNANLDPVLVTRKDPTLIYNQVKVEYIERAFDYNTNFYVAEDLASESLNGPLPAPVLALHSITSAVTAQQVAQLRLQRERYINPTSYSFVLGWKYSLLEPMDLLEITDAGLGLVATPVRITQTSEMGNEEGIQITAEPWPLGTATAVAYPVPNGQGARPNTNVVPGNTLNAFVIEGPAALISAPMELWIGANGGPSWGGCNVWASVDNVNFIQVGQVVGTAAFGTMAPSGLATSASQYPAVDTVNTGTVTLLSSRQLVTLSATDFAQLTYPCVIDGGTDTEWMTYETASLVGGSEYTLTHLYRGLYGTLPQNHPAGDGFMLVDNTVTRIPWPQGVTGTTVYFKLPAFNLYGAQLQDLTGLPTFTYVIGGSPLIIGGKVALDVTTTATATSGPNQTTISVNVIDPLATLGSASVSWSGLNWQSVIDASTSGALANPFTVVPGTPKSVILTVTNAALAGSSAITFDASGAGRYDGYATFTMGQEYVLANPSVTIAIGTSISPSNPTAPTSAVVNCPSNTTSIKWLASTSSQPSIASTESSGTSISVGGSPQFTIASLGFDLAVAPATPNTVYLTIVYYTGAAPQSAAMASATRDSLAATKTANYPAIGFASALPTAVDYQFANGVLGPVATGISFDQFDLFPLLPDGVTITAVAVNAYLDSTGPSALSAQFWRQDPAGSPGTLLGSGSAAATGWQVISGGFFMGENTTGRSYRLRGIWSQNSTSINVFFGTTQITYTMPGAATTL